VCRAYALKISVHKWLEQLGDDAGAALAARSPLVALKEHND